MAIRREAREKAVQFLFQLEINSTNEVDAALEQFWTSQHQALLDRAGFKKKVDAENDPGPTPDEVAIRAFADPLIKGVIEHRTLLDDKIQHYTRNWKLHRIAVVDRNILRLAIHEMLHRFDIPPIVSINEAIDIAKKYSTEDSGKFVNGILDKVKEDVLRPARVVT